MNDISFVEVVEAVGNLEEHFFALFLRQRAAKAAKSQEVSFGRKIHEHNNFAGRSYYIVGPYNIRVIYLNTKVTKRVKRGKATSQLSCSSRGKNLSTKSVFVRFKLITLAAYD